MRNLTTSAIHYALIAAAVILAAAAIAPASSVQDLPGPGADVMLRKTFNTSRFVYVEFGSRTVVYEHRDSRLFPVGADLPVRITEVNNGGTELEIKYHHPQLGEGSIKADFEDMGTGEARAAATVVVGHAFRIPGADDIYKPIIANRDTRVAHFVGSNHLPHRDQRLPFDSLESATGQGYRACQVCFFQTPRISNHQLETQMGRSCSAQVRFYSPLATDASGQQRLEGIASRVLGNWPMPLRGYTYRFWLLESGSVNASACPGGDVFVNTGMLDAIEEDGELEAILAHEIAHVELRHAYRRLRAAQRASFWTGLAAVAAGATTAAITGDAYDASTVAELTASLSALTSEIVLAGYGRDLEMESDSLAITYQQANPDDAVTSTALAQVLRKLRYSGEVRGYDMNSGQSAFSSHPHIADRIARAETAEARSMVGTTFVGYDQSGAEVAVLDFLLQSVSISREGGGLEVLAAIETTPALGDTAQIKDLRITAAGRRIELDNKEDTEVWPSDSVGIMLRSDDQHALLGDVTDLQLDLRNVATWRREQRSRPAASPTSVTARVATERARGGAPQAAIETVTPSTASAGSSGLRPPTLVNKGAQWASRTAEGVGYIWAVELENPNAEAIRSVVTFQIRDAEGEILFADTYELAIGGGMKAAFTDEGVVPDSVFDRAADWSFAVALGEGSGE